VGDEVSGCAGGEKVLGETLAEYIGADAKLIVIKPKNDLYAPSGCVSTGFDHGSSGIPKSGTYLHGPCIVHGGTGGVGHIGVQLAKVFGCLVATSVGTNDYFDQTRRCVCARFRRSAWGATSTRWLCSVQCSDMVPTTRGSLKRGFRQVRLAGRARHVNLAKTGLERSRFESGGRMRVWLSQP
jgi:hypothetical protein